MTSVLVTGGAGFIGSHLVDALLGQGYHVRVFDALEPQVHGPLAEQARWPTYCAPEAEYILGDVRDRSALARAVEGIDLVFHFAAATGVGQSMYQIAKYFEVNVQGTANLLDILANDPNRVCKLILSSSRAVYGEGAYQCETCGLVHPPVRSPAQLDAKQWDVVCPTCAGPITPIPTPETLAPHPGSMYAITKLTQEQMCLTFGQAYRLPVTALRFFNVYGPRQSLSNPYTGIITVFLSRLRAGEAPEVYEDGRMTRDFVYVGDVVQACLLALANDVAVGTAFNVGSGQATSIFDLATMLSDKIAPGISPTIVGVARVGDIGNCSADLTAIRKTLGYASRTPLDNGLDAVISDGSESHTYLSGISSAKQELQRFGLLSS